MHRPLAVTFLVALLLAAGCREAKVTSYQVPKEQPEPLPPILTGEMPAAPAAGGSMAGTAVATASGNDLLWTAPVLLLASPKTLEHMAIQAANGGIIPWQAGIDTGLGRVQFVLGREVGATWFGYSGGEDQLLVLSNAGNLVPISLRSIELEFPFVELRPLRDFSATQRATLLIQLGWGMDIPTKVTALYPPGAAAPNLKTSYFGYLKLAFDWRRYL